jgi:hypothetical protein
LLFIPDRTSGKLVLAQQFARATWGEIDPTSGRVAVKLTATREGAEICHGPGIIGSAFTTTNMFPEKTWAWWLLRCSARSTRTGWDTQSDAGRLSQCVA